LPPPSLEKALETGTIKREKGKGAEKRRRDRGKPAFLFGKGGDFHGLKGKETKEEGHGTSQDPHGTS